MTTKRSSTVGQIREILECPVCLEPPASVPIYTCDDGHILCHCCHQRFTNCPTCQTKLEDKRCLVSEKIVSEIFDKVRIEA